VTVTTLLTLRNISNIAFLLNFLLITENKMNHGFNKTMKLFSTMIIITNVS